ncbi:MAG: flippase, partial [Gemmatimonadaceae bacterium]
MPRVAYAFGEASNALNLLLFVVLARLLGVAPYGQFVAIIAASGILAAVSEFGFHSLLTRSVARDPASAWAELRHALSRQLLLGVPMLVLLYAYLRAASLPNEAQVAGLLIGASVWVKSLKETVRGVCRGLQRFGLEALFLWTERAALLLIAALALWAGGGIVALAVVFLAVRLVDFTVFFAAVRRALVPAVGGTRRASASYLAALPFAISNLMVIMYYQVDTTLLSLLSTAYDTGVYGAIYRFVDITQVIPRLLIVVSYPVMAVAWLRDRAGFYRMLHLLQRLLTCVALPVLFVIIMWSEELLRLFFGADYAVGAAALRFIMLGSYFAFHSSLYAQVLQASGHERLLATGLAATVGVKISLNVLLIPRYGFLGSAIATLATEVVYVTVLGMIAHRRRATDSHPVDATEIIGM